ncbi:DEKNAAC102387 [Brettanomyces naardenensis]|uniref:tRNA N(3)-methylcytidine methyltransferase n=1 Tax=Brettanomyces naardenensis TaxID=13370 RepID=A0A448YLQ1_BRENA|nr:DEKNAAC102387 [Brettanomyces naardenensis]
MSEPAKEASVPLASVPAASVPPTSVPKPPLPSRLGRDSPFDFGQRYLTDEKKVFQHNAWDNVALDEDQINQIKEKILFQREHPVTDFDKNRFNSKPEKYWDIFYKHNHENFFKDRKWLEIEFPGLYEATKKDSGPKTVLEIGCGAGNTMFPVLSKNENPLLKMYGCDFSKVAVDLVKQNADYARLNGSGNCYSSVWDLANEEGTLPEGIEPHSVDISVLIFVLSALSPKQWKSAVINMRKLMKPGGQVVFRDYGRYDLAQVRFKKERLLEDNFYIRGDGTRVYFFTEEEIRRIFVEECGFVEERIAMDRRLLVNRKKELKMYRCWLQGVFRT